MTNRPVRPVFWLISKGLFWMALMLAIVSCQRYERMDPQQPDPISVIRKQFQKDSANFFRNHQPNYNFRQSLQRIIQWDKVYLQGDTVYIPVQMRLPDNMRTARGSKILDRQALLRIRTKNPGSYVFDLLTLFPTIAADTSQMFTGMAIIEDFFTGNTGYALYNNGIAFAIPQTEFRGGWYGDGNLALRKRYECEDMGETISTVELCHSDESAGA